MNADGKNLAGLIISLPEDQLSPEMPTQFPDTVRRQSMFRSFDLDHEIQLSLCEGKISLAIAIPNAAIAVLFVSISASSIESFVLLLGGLITILNRVTIWDTYEYFAYGYRHPLRKRRIYRKISHLEIRIPGRPSPNTFVQG